MKIQDEVSFVDAEYSSVLASKRHEICTHVTNAKDDIRSISSDNYALSSSLSDFSVEPSFPEQLAFCFVQNNLTQGQFAR